MKVLYAIASAAALTLSLAGPAGAVDVTNPGVGDNMDNINLTITESGQSRTITLMNGETLYDICKECTIRAGTGKEVTVSQNDMVEVRGSSAKVYKFPANGQPVQRAPKDTSPIDALSSVDPDALALPENGPEGGSD